MHSFPHPFRALVIGSSGGIGHALVQRLRNTPGCSDVHTLSRSTQPALDLTREDTIERAALHLKTHAPFHVIIDATGVLQGQGAFPEKALRQISSESLTSAFVLNAIGPALLFKHLHPLLPRHGKSVFATLSARVGSIGDNHLGGWYGYRASKAALNMLLRTASIEIARRWPDAVCIALHPGTVHTNLSKNFVRDRDAFTPDQSAQKLLETIDILDASQTGLHFAYDASRIEW